jgi:hypothetical protein
MVDNGIKIINADEAEGVEPDLPEAGYKRDEELARRQDALDEAADQMQQEQETYAFDPSKLDKDFEILQHMDELNVDNRQPGFAYMWVYEGHGGQEIIKKQRLGWVVVTSADPECASLKDARGYRKIGDVILMRIPQDKFEKLEAAQEYRRLMQQEGIKGALRELGAKYRDKGFIIHDDARDVQVGRKGKNLMDMMETKSRQTGARQTAMKGVDKMLRDGTVPGIPTPGRGR